MPVALPIVSFFCVVILGALAAGPRIRTDIPQLALVLWLLVCNLIQGINSLIWAGNTDIHVPRWCDLVTKLLLGLVVAIPGACLCISMTLARAHEDKKVKNASLKRIQHIFDGVFCFLVPVAYMCLHFIVQDHRFNIAENFGCSASVYPANEAIVLMLVPPMLLGIAAFVSSTRAFHNFSRGFKSLDAHNSATTMSSFPDFSRRASTVMIIGAVTTIMTVFGQFIRSNIVPWVSWGGVHRNFRNIAIVKSGVDLVPIEYAWWSVSSISWLYIGLSLVLGEDVRDMIKSSPEIYASLLKRAKNFEFRLPSFRMPRRPLLPLHIRRRVAEPSSTLVEPEDNLVSGWDDMIDLKSKSPTPRSPTSSVRSKTSPANLSPSPRPSPSPTYFDKAPRSIVESPTAPVRDSASPEDVAFSAYTAQYLHSPTAHVLGLQTPLAPPPSVYKSPRKIADEQPPKQAPDVPVKLGVPQSVPDDVQSTISSIFDTPWPQPPCSPPPFTGTARVGQDSPAYSDTVFGEHEGSSGRVRNYARPFRGPSVHPVPEGVKPLNVVNAGRAASPTLGKARKYLRAGVHPPSNEAIFMTVVQETS
ncbi:pheromone A receptor-domain-containing protein [Lentinula raphanica]|uniref:Pheromone A receptor-domain-containing protein n=1 Tax=Lentinula raphanica TaxID=153919 RepID=A0AA38P074_9AGAR|nr:pheromone A receptor-domain-containing protein [Lentinula raphanica]